MPFSARVPRSAMLNGMREGLRRGVEDRLDERRINADVRRHHHDVVRFEIGLLLRRARATDRATPPSRASGCGRNGIGANESSPRPARGAWPVGSCNLKISRWIWAEHGIVRRRIEKGRAPRVGFKFGHALREIRDRVCQRKPGADSRAQIAGRAARSRAPCGGHAASSRSDRISLHQSGVGRMTKRCTSVASASSWRKCM